MTSLIDRHLYPIFMLPSKLLVKFQSWIYGYIRLLLGMVCSVSCIFCVFTFIWYLTFRGLYGFLINLQLYQPPTGCGSDDDSDLTMEYTDYQSGKRGSFLTRCRAQAELIQQTLKKNRSNGDKSPNGHNVKLNSGSDGNVTTENNVNNQHHHHHHHHRCQNHHHHHNSPNKENSAHGQLLVRNSSYVSEIYYDENGHKIGEQIYLTNDSDGLEESYFQFKVNDYQHLKELGGISTSVLVEEEPVDGGEQQQSADVEMVSDPSDDKIGACGGGEDKIIDSGDDNNSGNTTSTASTITVKDRSLFSISVSHSPESTTSYCSSILTDEPGNTFEDDSSAKTIAFNNSTILTCSTTTIVPPNPTTQPLLLKSESLENVSTQSNNNSDKICSTTTTNKSNKYPIDSIKEEETKDSTINLVSNPSTEKVNCNVNEKPNGVQLKRNGTSESQQTTNGDAKSLNGVNKSQTNLINSDDHPVVGPSRKSKRKRRNNNNYSRSKNS